MGNYVPLEFLTLLEFIEECKTMEKISLRKHHWIGLINTNRLTCPITGLVVNHCKFLKGKRKLNIELAKKLYLKLNIDPKVILSWNS